MFFTDSYAAASCTAEQFFKISFIFGRIDGPDL